MIRSVFFFTLSIIGAINALDLCDPRITNSNLMPNSAANPIKHCETWLGRFGGVCMSECIAFFMNQADMGYRQHCPKNDHVENAGFYFSYLMKIDNQDLYGSGIRADLFKCGQRHNLGTANPPNLPQVEGLHPVNWPNEFPKCKVTLPSGAVSNEHDCAKTACQRSDNRPNFCRDWWKARV